MTIPSANAANAAAANPPNTPAPSGPIGPLGRTGAAWAASAPTPPAPGVYQLLGIPSVWRADGTQSVAATLASLEVGPDGGWRLRVRPLGTDGAEGEALVDERGDAASPALGVLLSLIDPHKWGPTSIAFTIGD